jgi:hypothetical protein
MTVASWAMGAPLSGIPQPLKRNLACMVRVLKATPGINRVKVGAHIGTNFFLTNGPSQSHGEKWLRPYVEYRVFERGRWGNIRFGADRVGKAGHYSYEFWTALGGVYGAGEPGPNDWRTNEISKKWKTRCGVYANGLFV